MARRKASWPPPWFAEFLKPTHRPGYLSAKQYEARLRRNAAVAEAEFRQLKREAIRKNKESAKEIRAVVKALGRKTRQTQNFIARKRRQTKKLFRVVARQETAAKELRRIAPSTKLKYSEEMGLKHAIAIAIERNPGKDIASGTERFLRYQQPAIARQWIRYYVYGEGEEPDWVYPEDIADYYGE